MPGAGPRLPRGARQASRPDPLPRRTPASPASWTEYQRLLAAGVRPPAAAILATGTPRPTTDETAYWRQLARGQRPTAAAQAAHAAAQRARRLRRNDLSRRLAR